jgi:hypothetical protein
MLDDNAPGLLTALKLPVHPAEQQRARSD